jgi:hypothetical protein
MNPDGLAPNPMNLTIRLDHLQDPSKEIQYLSDMKVVSELIS